MGGLENPLETMERNAICYISPRFARRMKAALSNLVIVFSSSIQP